jgi:hypothetical protein
LRRIHFILLFLLVLPLHSCQEEGACTGVDVARIKAGFYVRSDGPDRDTFLNNVTFYSSLRPDSLIYDSAFNLPELLFPLPNDEKVDVDFNFRVDSLTDIITVYKSSILVMESFECGFVTHHNLRGLGYQNNIIDTIVISDPLVNLIDVENIKIYIKPAVAADTAQ